MVLEEISKLPETLKDDFFKAAEGLVEDDGWCLRHGIDSINPFGDKRTYVVAYNELFGQGFFINQQQREAILVSIPYY